MTHLPRLLLLLCALALPAQAQEQGQPSGTIETEQEVGGDAAIERRIERILAELNGYEGVAVDVREGIVTFSGAVLEPEAIARLDELASRVNGVVAIENEVVEDTDVARRLNPVLDRFRARLVQAVAYLPLLAVAIVAGLAVVALGILLARWEAPWRRLAPNAFIGEIYRVVLRLAFVLAGVVVALDILNATAVLTGLLGAAGIVGLAVGFAVRDTVENFIASVMLSLRQPFRPHDFVDIDGTLGTVIRLTSRATILLDPDGNHVRLSNAFVFKAKIINYTRNDTRRFGFALGIDPADDLAEARRIGLETLRALDFVLADPAPAVWVKEAGDSTVTMEFFAWINQRETDFMVSKGEALRLVMAALTRAGIGLPEPSYRLNLGGGGLPVIGLPDSAKPAESMVISEDEPPPEQKPLPLPGAQDVAADPTIGRMVEEERKTTAQRDLLSPAAPEE
ncbi:mechanosensitive ion channel domain-containing protein [Jannaschia formosa]|uniref:mechanosensitive ion channel domain-containing protein n=1 Tax=Jannaschia formosa TaxID=2259592 RepID=UPI000E1B8E36|nr:mechanosensitive ion channel domain-containing protein [Jannaschia formosa]TFL19650.1 mechanosensitive ion channel [Jannaschia formosa]